MQENVYIFLAEDAIFFQAENIAVKAAVMQSSKKITYLYDASRIDRRLPKPDTELF